jgi:hypothetical protein
MKISFDFDETPNWSGSASVCDFDWTPNWSESASVSGSYTYVSDKPPSECGCDGNLEVFTSDHINQVGVVEWECEKCGQSFIKEKE